ncbi:MAG: LacI family DNA-binding transcriptional regulator, partial [Spirochaetales bacterium]|nr:LacI family DNA-binding transcriptional regulator [Spirochaetales bacterium]
MSRSTVSKVINGYGDVGQETRKRVLKVIKDFGYSPNLAARILAGKGVETIGLFFLLQRDESYDLANDSIVDQMMAVVIDAAARLGFLTLTVIIRNIDAQSEAQIRDIFTQGRIDAGIFLGCRSSEPVIEELVGKGFLVGAVDYPRPRPQEKNLIIANYDPDTGEKAVDYLTGLGHRDIMGIQGDLFRYDGSRKYQGFSTRLKEKGLIL